MTPHETAAALSEAQKPLSEPHESILADLNDLQTWAAMMAGRAPRIVEVLGTIQRARVHIIECRAILERRHD